MQEFRVFRAIGLSFKAWFGNFIPITLLAALIYAPAIVWIMTSDPSQATSSEQLVDHYMMRPVYMLVGLSTLVAPLITYRIIQDLNGTRVSIFTSMKYGLRGIVPAVILAVTTTVLGLVPMGGIIGAIITCIWFVASPSAVAERLGPIAALSRSATLTSGRRWGIFGLTFVLGLLLVVAIAAYIVPTVNNPDRADPIGHFKNAVLAVAVIIAVFNTLRGIVEAVSYALLRQDKDGVTHDELARVFE